MSHNPYAPPEAPVSDAGPLPPGSAPPTVRMYNAAQIGVATFLGTFMAAAYFYARNLDAVGHGDKKGKAWLIGFGATVVSMVIAYLLPDKTPNVILPLMCSLVARMYTDMNFGKTLKTHFATGGPRGSWWRVVGISLLFALGVLAVITVVVLLFMPREM